MITIPERLSIETETWRRLLDNQAAEMHFAKPGIVQSFDGKNTVTVLIAIKEKILQNDMTIDDVSYPMLVDVPVIQQRSGGFKATMPIKKGDECLVIFADMGIDWWWQSGGVQNKTEDLRRHDLSDGFAIFGPWSKPNAPGTYPSNAARIGKDDDSAYFEVTESGQVNIKGPCTFLNNATFESAIIDKNGIDHTTHQHSVVGVQGGSATIITGVPET